MKVILLKDVPKLGKKFDVKNVADGFASNSLIPRGLAVLATAKSLATIESEKSQDMAEREIQKELLAKNIETLRGLSIKLKEKANEKGHLFAGVTKEMLVAEILKEVRLNINPDFIELDKPLKTVGEHKVTVTAMDKKAELNVVIEKI